MGTVASQITSFTIVYTTVYSDADQSKHQSSASLAFVWEIHRGPVNSPHKWPVTRKCFHLMTSSCQVTKINWLVALWGQTSMLSTIHFPLDTIVNLVTLMWIRVSQCDKLVTITINLIELIKHKQHSLSSDPSCVVFWWEMSPFYIYVTWPDSLADNAAVIELYVP